MPRSDRFDPFTISLFRFRAWPRSERRGPAGEVVHLTPGGPHDGAARSEVDELLQVRMMNAQLEALAGLEGEALEIAARKRALYGGRPVRVGLPIGALPPTERWAPLGALRDICEEVWCQVRVLQSSLQDATRATGRLAALPLEVARLAAQRLRLTHG